MSGQDQKREHSCKTPNRKRLPCISNWKKVPYHLITQERMEDLLPTQQQLSQ